MNNLEISWATLWRIFFMLLLITVLFLSRQVLIILFLAIVISAAFDAPVSYLESKKIPRFIGVILIFLSFLSVLVLLLYTLIPSIIIELKNFLDALDKLEIPFLGSLETSQFTEKIDKVLENAASLLFSGGMSFFNIVTTLFGNAVLIIATLAISFYLTINRSGVENFLKAILPVGYEDYVVDLYLRTRKKLGFWLQGQILLMLTVGIAVFLGLLILGVKYSLVLGVLAGLLEIVPIAGPIISGILAFLVAISDSWTLGIYTIILFLVIQQLENHLLVPLIMKKAIGISPVIVVIAILAGYQIAGFAGIILAVPTAVIFQELIEDWDKRKIRAPKS